MSEKQDSSVRLFSYADDQPHEERGALIPGAQKTSKAKFSFTPASAMSSTRKAKMRTAISMVGLFALAILGTTGYGLVAQSNLAAAPVVTIYDPYTQSSTALEYGPQISLANNNFFIETRDAFIDESLTFVEIDMNRHQLRFFKKGVLLQSAEIFGLGEDGSWWETPSGLYEVEKKDEQLFTNIGQVYLPWLITFQGNYLIHGWPTYPDESVVGEGFKAGGVRLSDESAQTFYKNVRIGTPVLVHAAEEKKRDTFVYEPQVPELDTQHYFIADIDNGTILAASDLEAVAPIASLVKLMTAVVAAEEINLDGRIRVTSPTFVTSLIPRLSQRSSVSMYSLLQLLLVESSNEAAETIAGEIGREEFIEAMNAKARQLGMMNTHFADPSGLSSENVSSLGDLYRLTKYINDKRGFIFEITNHAELTSAYVGGEFNGLINFNEIEDMDNFVGGKVGETLAAGQTSISLHDLQFQGEQRTLVIIILGSKGRTADIESLISYVENHFGR
ncbi:MAG: L,D-transpeptidase family protein [Candidatus Pacebacteria bacterium]|nr:L,D-transpeptidase family protein [Candidatus Paceibacterota bacterium]